MAKITLNGREIEAPEGAPLVEVIKDAGVFISNLCYLEGLPPYAGCRTCLVEVEGAPALQLACTSKVTDGMVVRTDTDEVKKTRQTILSLILSYHSDRCLTCHRVVKCKPGDTCLRDNVVTHRCVTCSKNYRCELQTTHDLLGMGEESVEPWAGEEGTYYQTEQPEPDRANPWFEFDPQMCIICTRCVRTCADCRALAEEIAGTARLIRGSIERRPFDVQAAIEVARAGRRRRRILAGGLAAGVAVMAVLYWLLVPGAESPDPGGSEVAGSWIEERHQEAAAPRPIVELR